MAEQHLKETTHPAESLSLAITRAAGMASALSTCFDQQAATFVVDARFVFQALAAIESFMGDAQVMLADLCDHCDLTLRHDQRIERAPLDSPSGNDTFSAAGLATHVDEDIFAEQGALPQQPDSAAEPAVMIFESGFMKGAGPEQPQTESPPPAAADIATSYDELIRKLTAAEIFATEQLSTGLRATNSPLLPLLKSLRTDLKNFRVA